MKTATSYASTSTTSSPEEGKKLPKPGEALAKRAVIETILPKHDAATAERNFNAILATCSINDAIEYYGLFKDAGRETAADPDSSRSKSPAFSPRPPKATRTCSRFKKTCRRRRQDNEQDPRRKEAR